VCVWMCQERKTTHVLIISVFLKKGLVRRGIYSLRLTDHNMFIEQRGPPPPVGMLCPACAVPWFIADSGGGGGGKEVVIVTVLCQRIDPLFHGFGNHIGRTTIL
jgi:hypothetical protein